MTKIALPIILIFAVLAIFSFGVMAMHMDKHSSCPFMGSMAICPMSMSEHLLFIQNIFSSTPRNVSFLVSLLLLALFIKFVFILDWNQRTSKSLIIYNRSQNLTSPNKFLLALSDGIVQPKLYN